LPLKINLSPFPPFFLFAVVKRFTDAVPDYRIQLPYKEVFDNGDRICAAAHLGDMEYGIKSDKELL